MVDAIGSDDNTNCWSFFNVVQTSWRGWKCQEEQNFFFFFFFARIYIESIERFICTYFSFLFPSIFPAYSEHCFTSVLSFLLSFFLSFFRHKVSKTAINDSESRHAPLRSSFIQNPLTSISYRRYEADHLPILHDWWRQKTPTWGPWRWDCLCHVLPCNVSASDIHSNRKWISFAETATRWFGQNCLPLFPVKFSGRDLNPFTSLPQNFPKRWFSKYFKVFHKSLNVSIILTDPWTLHSQAKLQSLLSISGAIAWFGFFIIKMAASECGDLLEIRREHEETWEMKEDEKARMGPDEEGNSILSQGGSLRQSILQRIRRTATIRRGEIKKRSKQAENQAAR